MARLRINQVAVGLSLLLAACNKPPVQGIARGQALWSTCAHCHGQNGGGNAQLAAPAIAGLPRWYVQAQLEGFQAARRGYDPFDTTGIRMKSVSWTLDDSTDAASVAEYVASLPPARPAPSVHGNPASGQVTFQVCAGCHGANAAGNEEVHAPPLTVQSDWYLLTQLHKFKNGWRGTNAADMWGTVMRPNAMMPDDTTMANVVAYIQTLRGASSTP